METWEEISKTELCPFCGVPASVLKTKNNRQFFYKVKCCNYENCGVYSETEVKTSKQLAIKTWKDREIQDQGEVI